MFYHISCLQLLKVNFDPFELNLYFSISYYATTSTITSVYIIGGVTNGSPRRSSTIAKYRNGLHKLAIIFRIETEYACNLLSKTDYVFLQSFPMETIYDCNHRQFGFKIHHHVNLG